MLSKNPFMLSKNFYSPKTQSDWASLKRFFLCGTDACYLWGLCTLQTIRRHGMSIQEELWIAEWRSLWRFGSHLWRLTTIVGRGLCDLSSRRIWWGSCVQDCVSSSLNTQPLQPDVKLSQQLELVDQINVFTKPIGYISSTLSFPQLCVDEPDHYCLKTLTE